MEHVTTRRRLVKSPPELWAEVSDPAALARRLGELGEIRITRTLPETTVAWEAERATGIIEIEASGWGTRVSLSASPAGTSPEPPERVETEVRVVGEESRRIEIPRPAPEPEPAPRAGFFARLFGGEAEQPPAPPAPPPEVLELRLRHAVCASRVPERPAAAGAIEGPALQEVLERALDDLGAAHHRPFSRA